MSEWIEVCGLQDLVEGAGVAALVKDTQIALFLLAGKVYALNNYDPVGKANVMSRGMIGDLKGQPMVASPLQKLHYNLETGACMDKEGVVLQNYPVQLKNNRVFIEV
ncbi:nitrite reductase small subunit NirD [Thiosulfativibrio zosterae]|uniref:Rieske-like [2Fe-2S] domain-containing protein n=1 Tax=Thiosulfativibrio zosterae TaxID=2675053 RepID=A0A6F8PNR1_9GAMM|nr:nitrite reductase small subunit NirD [Thiosulfativibrio zosterae]BBP43735.1 hypothetical protein THMIRHAT_14810 [Thiosulfativibrio zosterae]